MQSPQLLIPTSAELLICSMGTRVVEALKNGFRDAASDIQSTAPVQAVVWIPPPPALADLTAQSLPLQSDERGRCVIWWVVGRYFLA